MFGPIVERAIGECHAGNWSVVRCPQIHPYEGTGTTEVTNVCGELRAPVQCGTLSPLISNPRPQEQRSYLPIPGTMPRRSGNAGRTAASAISLPIRVGRIVSIVNRAKSWHELHMACAGEPRSSVAAMPSGSSTASLRYWPNGIAAASATASAAISMPVFE